MREVIHQICMKLKILENYIVELELENTELKAEAAKYKIKSLKGNENKSNKGNSRNGAADYYVGPSIMQDFQNP